MIRTVCRLIPVLIIVLVSCSEKPKVPKDVLPKDKMVAVLYDMLAADELATYRAYSDSSFKSKNRHTELYETVFTIHHTSREQFRKSIAYYQNYPDELKTMFDSLQSKVDRQVKADSVSFTKYKRLPNADSLRHILP